MSDYCYDSQFGELSAYLRDIEKEIIATRELLEKKFEWERQVIEILLSQRGQENLLSKLPKSTEETSA